MHTPSIPTTARPAIRLGWRGLAAAAASLAAAAALADISIPSVPLGVRQAAQPLVMLVASKEHRLFYEAYNDASDIDGDGTLDIRFKPSITYLGLFNPDLCYEHNGAHDGTGLFTPKARSALPGRTCTRQWSGNWLNYVTTSRIDALRVVLYGGTREVDTASETVLRRAYIPQDGHSWAKEYSSEQADGYRITDYTPLSAPVTGRRHFFGNLTRAVNVDCATLHDCSDRAPLLSVVTNSTRRVWEWASSERPVLGNTPLANGISPHGGTLSEYAVRVLACPNGYTDGCKLYGTVAKPIGLLHEFGESALVLFGLLTGSYDRNLSGGRLRKPVSSFREEINPENGTFTPSATLVRTLDAIRIRDFNNGRTNYTYKGDRVDTGAPAEGSFVDWGNPVGEMMYEALRYFAGKKSATADFAGTSALDGQVGLSSPTWDDPYDTRDSQAKAPMCARASLLVISDTNVSHDSDQVPGAHAQFLKPGFAGDLSGLNALAEADAITQAEPGFPGDYFIGQSGATFDTAPTAKRVESLGAVRGLAPEEPTKQGSYHAAAVARYGKRTDLRTDLPGTQNVETFVVGLASPLPRIVVPMSGGRFITLVPFAKSVGGGNGKISADKGSFQPTNQIVDFYVETIANSGAADADPAINAGRYFARFRINYEDTEQGSDHDMDVIVQYTIQRNADDTLTVTMTPVYQGGGIRHRIGYVISGTGKDGVYLEVQDESDETPYFLNTPPGRDPGYCDASPVRDDCRRLPYLGGPAGKSETSRVFTPGSSTAAGVLKDPLWYAAKWGGFTDRNGNGQPDLTVEWDADGDGVPDAFMPVQNPLRLQLALRKALDTIVSRASAASSLASNSTSVSAGTFLYQALFETRRWSGDLLAWNVSRDGLSRVPAWRASVALPPWQDRRIFMHKADGTGMDRLDTNSLPGVSADIVNYLRGERGNERQNGGALRDRNSPLGAIIHSSPLYARDTDTVYVGASDGMLHAFDAKDGRERFAVIPRATAGALAGQASLGHVHAYGVDGELARAPRGPLTGDRSYLYALLGRGAKGLFSLDITHPGAFGSGNFLWEYPSAPGGANASDPDLGLMLGQPVVVPLNNGSLGVIVGNGYNSSSGKAVLYIFSVRPDGSLERTDKIDTGVAADNGLGTPATLDTNNDGRADLVYAGDLQGNVWKFDLTGSDPAKWKIGYDGKPMFRARYAPATTPASAAATPVTAKPQPITAPLLAVVNNQPGSAHQGQRFVFFGTGAYLRDADPADTSVQTWYGLIDEGETPIQADRSELRERPIQASGDVGGRLSRVFAAAKEGDMAGRRGWYIDLTLPRAGERIITAPRIVPLAVPALMATSIDPVTSDPCVPGGRGFLSLVDPYTGGALSAGLIDALGNGEFGASVLGGKLIGSIELGVGLPSAPSLIRRSQGLTTAFVSGSASGDPQSTGSGTGIQGTGFKSKPGGARRISWREIIRD